MRRVAVWLLLVACGASAPACARQPAYSTDIAPIIFEHCVSCHQPGHAAPFSLLAYADAQPRASAIAAAVASRYMPPWLPEHGGQPFVGERRLPDDQMALIQQWARTGAREGDPRRLPPAPGISTTWQLGTPDLVAAPPQPYTLAPGGHDVYRNLVVRLTVPTTRYVRALEFLPGAAPVHHAVIRVDTGRRSRTEDGVDGQPGFDGMAAYDVQDPDGHFLGWAPGRGPIVAPDRLSWRLNPGSDLVVELHLMPGEQAITVQPTIGLYFTDTPPVQSPVMLVMGSKAIDIPAGARAYSIEDRYELPVDVEVLSLYPHAHYLGRAMEVRAIAPGGTARQLIRIPKWSFNWQQDYRLVTPVALDRGTTIAMKYSYDNATTRRVTWGPQSHDEMGNLGVQVVTRSVEDARRLTESFTQHAILIDVAGAETLVKADPTNAMHAAFLGTSYVRAGRFGAAIPALQRALQLNPRSSANENYLGGALLAEGRGREALVHFQRATALAPQDAHLHFNLAKVLAAAGDGRGAYREYARALALDPDFGEAHQHLGVLLFSAGRLPEALRHLQRAVDLLPGSADAHGDLGGALAEAGRHADARPHLERAVQIDPSNQTARENLARLGPQKPR